MYHAKKNEPTTVDACSFPGVLYRKFLNLLLRIIMFLFHYYFFWGIVCGLVGWLLVAQIADCPLTELGNFHSKPSSISVFVYFLALTGSAVLPPPR